MTGLVTFLRSTAHALEQARWSDGALTSLVRKPYGSEP